MPWDTYQKADLISDRELQLIKRYDKQDRTLQRSLLQEEDGVLYVRAFFSLLRSIASEEVVQYVLALLEDMIREGGARRRRRNAAALYFETRAQPARDL